MLKSRLYHVQQRMSRPFGHAAYTRHASDSVVLHLALDDAPGLSGIGECAPRTYVTGEKSPSVIRKFPEIDLAEFVAILAERDAQSAFAQLATATYPVGEKEPTQTNIRCLCELALFDLLCHLHSRGCIEALAVCLRAQGLNEAFLPTANIDRLPVTAVIDSVAGLNVVPSGTPPAVIKVKVGDDLQDNRNKVNAVRARYGYDARLIVDANMSWSFDSALSHVKALSPFDVYLYEEPLPTRQYALLRRLRQRTGAKVMLDESLVTYEDAVAAVEQEACDAFNIRVSKCGGLLPSMRLIDFALSRAMPYQLGVQVAEVGPLINASRALAFLYGRHFTVEAGQSDRFFEESIVSPRPEVDRSMNVISRPTGIGFGMALNSNAAAYAVGEMLAS